MSFNRQFRETTEITPPPVSAFTTDSIYRHLIGVHLRTCNLRQGF